jgi:hypothetical protein
MSGFRKLLPAKKQTVNHPLVRVDIPSAKLMLKRDQQPPPEDKVVPEKSQGGSLRFTDVRPSHIFSHCVLL